VTISDAGLHDARISDVLRWAKDRAASHKQIRAVS
jgi:hypothetical protein